jgi:hypothetical protein
MLVLFIILASSALGYRVEETHGVSSTSSQTTTQTRGIQFNISENVTLTEAVFWATVGAQDATKAYLLHSNGTHIQNTTISKVGSYLYAKFTPAVQLIGHREYLIVSDRQGNTYYSKYKNGGAGLPINTGYVTWTNGSALNRNLTFNTSTNWYRPTGDIYNVLGIKLNYSVIDNCSNLVTKSINLTIRDASNDAVTPGTINGYVTVSEPTNNSNSDTYQLSWDNGGGKYGMCIVPGNYTLNADLEYTDGDTETNEYYIVDANINTTVVDHDLYIGDTGTTVTVYLYDEYDTELLGYYIHAYAYDVGTGTSTLIYAKKSDADGKALMDLTLNTQQYYFKVYDADTLLDTTDNTVLTSTTYSIRVSLGATQESPILTLQGLKYDLSANYGTRNFTLNWSDPNNLTYQKKLVVKRNTVNQSTTLYTKVYNVSTSNLYYKVPTTNATYTAYFYVTYNSDGETYLLSTETLDYSEEYAVFGNETLILAFFFIGTMAMVGLFLHPSAMFVFTMIGMIIFWALGFMMVSLSGLIGLFISFILMMIKLRNQR